MTSARPWANAKQGAYNNTRPSVASGNQIMWVIEDVKLFGNIFSVGRIGPAMSPEWQKVEALKTTDPPANISELRCLLDLASYCSRRIADFAMITQPMRYLTVPTKAPPPRTWSSKQDDRSSKNTEETDIFKQGPQLV